MYTIRDTDVAVVERSSVTGSKITRLERILLLVWFVASLGIGVLTVHEYGMSIDEPNNYRYAADTLDAYPSLFGILYEPKLDSSYQGHGPAFVVLASIGIRIIQSVFPDVFEPDLWHFSYFITFLATGLCLYWLTRRWFNAWTAWGILVLFVTQPMLLGHAFMNPKDIPFMFFLTLSVVLGFRMVDGMEPKGSFVSLQKPVNSLAGKFRAADPRRKRKFLTYLALALAITLVLIVFSRQVDALIEQYVTYFYTATPDTWAGRIFSSIANPAAGVPAQDYVIKTLRLFSRLERAILLVGVLFFAAYFGLLIGNRTIPNFLHNIWDQRHMLGESLTGFTKAWQSSLRTGSLKNWLMEILRTLGNPRVILAGVVLGLATAVRAIGPLAGVIVLCYLFVQVRSRAWTTAIAYFLVTGIVTYFVWPYLWDAPILHFLEELGVISNFQHFSGRVLFGGQFYGIRDLPRTYLPVLLSIQFTEPLILSVYIGLGVLGWRILHSHLRTDLLIYLGLGFALPLFGLIALNSPLYHNLRQVLFMIPAMFVLAAFTLDLVFSKINRSWARLLLIAAIALPGIYSSTKLYPYEYVYYNSLVGGPAGAYNRYELDYWRTAMREMAIELNELAPQGSKIIISGSSSLFRRYVHPDLIVETVAQSTYDVNGGYDYAVQIARWQKWDLYPDAKIEILIEREGAVLATVKAVRNASMK